MKWVKQLSYFLMHFPDVEITFDARVEDEEDVQEGDVLNLVVKIERKHLPDDVNWVDSDDADGVCPEVDTGDTGTGVVDGGGSPSKDVDGCGSAGSLAIPFGLGLLGLAGRRRRSASMSETVERG